MKTFACAALAALVAAQQTIDDNTHFMKEDEPETPIVDTDPLLTIKLRHATISNTVEGYVTSFFTCNGEASDCTEVAYPFITLKETSTKNLVPLSTDWTTGGNELMGADEIY